MNIRQELETLLSISQGTMEDYNEYLLRVLEEINAVDDPTFNSMSKATQDWVNTGVLAYNANQPIPEFPKTATQVKVEPVSKVIQISNIARELDIKADWVFPVKEFTEKIKEVLEPETIVDSVIKEEVPSIVEQEPEISISNEIQDTIAEQFESLPKKELDLPTTPNIYSVKKKRGRPKGSTSKPKECVVTEGLEHSYSTLQYPFKDPSGDFVVNEEDMTIWDYPTAPDFKRAKKDIPDTSSCGGVPIPLESSISPSADILQKSSEERDCTTCDAASGECSTSCIHTELSEQPKVGFIIPEGVITGQDIDSLYNTLETINTYDVAAMADKEEAILDISTEPTSGITEVIGDYVDEDAMKTDKELIEDFIKEEAFIAEYESSHNESSGMLELLTDCGASMYNIKEVYIRAKPQKPLDVFRTLVCQNHDKPFEEIYKLTENQSIGIKKSTALVTCSQIKATINTLRSLGMLKEDICK